MLAQPLSTSKIFMVAVRRALALFRLSHPLSIAASRNSIRPAPVFGSAGALVAAGVVSVKAPSKGLGGLALYANPLTDSLLPSVSRCQVERDGSFVRVSS